MKQPEYEFSGRTSNKAYYIISVDVGRIGCQTAIMVFKVTPQLKGSAIKSLVNIYAFDEEHFRAQALKIKRLYYKYNPKAIVVDGNGLITIAHLKLFELLGRLSGKAEDNQQLSFCSIEE